MRRNILSHGVPVVRVLLLLLVTAVIDHTAVLAERAAGTPPTTLVAGGVTSYALAYPRVVWHTASICTLPPSLAGDSNSSTTIAPADPELITRIPAYGGLPRILFSRNDPRPPGQCNPYRIYSNVVADGSYVYWADDNGLVRLPVTANPSLNAPELMSATIQSVGNGKHVELADGGNYLYAIIYPSNTSSQVWRIDKSTFAKELVDDVSGLAANLSEKDLYIYWVVNNNLQRAYQVFFGFNVITIATDVTGYYPEGEIVFIAQGREVVRYNNEDGATSDPIYTSSHPLDPTSVDDLVSDGTNLFLLENRPFCPPPGCFDFIKAIVRTGRFNDDSAALIYEDHALLAFNLTADDETIYWQEEGRVLKLPKNAETLPMTNMTIARIEVTQGIQDIANNVPLIGSRYTYVRVFGLAEGEEVSGVTARLYRVHPASNAILDGPLLPINTTGMYITVPPYDPQLVPQAEDGGFLFELPLEWVQAGIPLRLMAQLNPFNTPTESNPSDNTAYTDTFIPILSPRLHLHLYPVIYNLGTLTIAPRPEKDIQQTFNWMRRAYPLASVSSDDNAPGLRPAINYIYLPELLSYVNQTNPYCQFLITLGKPGNLCAAIYLKPILHAWQDDYDGPGEPPIYVGMIPDNAGFPRGRGGGGVAITPSGVSCCGHDWDTDGAYTDWYSGHEIGHALGRNHPVSGSEQCGHSADDGGYPFHYSHSAIGPYLDNGVELGINWGFDQGAAYFGIPRAVLPSSIWRDVMGYCQYQWISDYTYLGLYNNIIEWDARLAANRVAVPAGGSDVLSVYGSLLADRQVAFLNYVRRHDRGVTAPPLVPGDFAIRLLDSQGGGLAEYAFTPEAEDDGTSIQSFGQIVPFVAGTSRIQIVQLSTNTVWAEQAVSANAPAVNNITLNATSPVTGTATASWTAVDPDGDPLTFDLSYSQNGGATFEHLAFGLTEASLAFDANRLGGGSTILRVTASDGVLIGSADSTPFTIANKPPHPTILNPADGLHVEWGQPIKFSGEAMDWQDGYVDSAQLGWSNQYGALGTGAALMVADLPVGENEITLTATNSLGLSASTSITVVVEDDLELPGPMLVVGPTALGWHVAADSGVQTSIVHVLNAGSGEMTWTAETDAAWLTLEVTDSGVPGTLTVRADPTDLPENETQESSITITATFTGNEPPQTITIPAILAIGDVYTTYERPKVYLPVILRK